MTVTQTTMGPQRNGVDRPVKPGDDGCGWAGKEKGAGRARASFGSGEECRLTYARGCGTMRM